MNNTLHIEPIEAAQIDQIMSVMARAFAPEYGESWSLPQCTGMLSLPGSHLTVARWGNRVAGFALFRQILDESELLLIGVDPDYQKLGVGAALLDAYVAHCLAQGIRRLHLEVRGDNPARRFYTNRAFQEVGLRANYYRGRDGKYRDAVTLSRILG